MVSASEPIVYIDHSNIREGSLDELKAGVQRLVDFIEAREPQLVSYGFYIDDEAARMTVVAVHPDTASLELHLEIGGPEFRKLAPLLTLTAIECYGRPSQKALASWSARQPRWEMAETLSPSHASRGLSTPGNQLRDEAGDASRSPSDLEMTRPRSAGFRPSPACRNRHNLFWLGRPLRGTCAVFQLSRHPRKSFGSAGGSRKWCRPTFRPRYRVRQDGAACSLPDRRCADHRHRAIASTRRLTSFRRRRSLHPSSHNRSLATHPPSRPSP